LVAVEETKGADDTSTRAFGATIRRHRFLGVAGCCINRFSKRISLLAVAYRFCVLRSEWCQRWCQEAMVYASTVLANQIRE